MKVIPMSATGPKPSDKPANGDLSPFDSPLILSPAGQHVVSPRTGRTNFQPGKAEQQLEPPKKGCRLV